MQKNAASCVLALAVMTSGCATPQRDGNVQASGERVPAEFIDSRGARTGSAVLTETANGVLIDVELRNLEPGWHGFHIHERGDCRRPDFESAGGHFMPDAQAHGFMTGNGPHAGDLPNLFVGMDGTARVQAIAAGVSLRAGGNALMDHDGAAIVVHSGEDDYRSQPSGGSGKRVSCAEIG
ncbi:MAG TPA: superoxide dismutase family protein [Gammaproteobacteria bacterium]